MGLGLLASRTLRSSRVFSSASGDFFLRSIGSTTELCNAKASAAQESATDLPKRTPVGDARVHFPNPDDAIKVFVDGTQSKSPKG
nr:NADH dehydrogenase [ubiquinone] iron-sulfur protein 1, mitochondrial [Ipomoea batatas]